MLDTDDREAVCFISVQFKTIYGGADGVAECRPALCLPREGNLMATETSFLSPDGWSRSQSSEVALNVS